MPETGTGISTASEALHQVFYSLWQFGGNALVGWMPTRYGIEVITVPKIRLYNTAGLPRRVFAGGRLMGRHTFREAAQAFGIEPVEVRLEQPVGEAPGCIPPRDVERVFLPFAVTKTDQRAVALLDIVGFSLLSPEQQGSQLATLEFALNIAAEAAREQGVVVADERSTTGDGFYLWNGHKGFDADIDLFVLSAFLLTYYSVLRRTIAVSTAVPTVRVVLGIGSHYSYHQPRYEPGDRAEYIVGDVTITLARLIGEARPGQLLVSDFARSDDGGGILQAADFIRQVGTRLAEIKRIRVLGHALDHFSFYLTGPPAHGGGFSEERFSVTDKHGLTHAAYNGKLNVFLENGDSFFCGLQHADLR